MQKTESVMQDYRPRCPAGLDYIPRSESNYNSRPYSTEANLRKYLPDSSQKDTSMDKSLHTEK